MSFSFGKHTPILSPLGFWIWVLISAINCNWYDCNWCDCNCMLVWLQRCDCNWFDCNLNRLKCYWLQLIWLQLSLNQVWLQRKVFQSIYVFCHKIEQISAIFLLNAKISYILDMLDSTPVVYFQCKKNGQLKLRNEKTDIYI